MPQPPDLATVRHVLERAQAIHGDELATSLGQALTEDWQYAAAQAGDPANQLVWTAVQQLVRAVKLRHAGNHSLANMTDHLAEAAALGWLDELDVSTAEVPEHG